MTLLARHELTADWMFSMWLVGERSQIDVVRVPWVWIEADKANTIQREM